MPASVELKISKRSLKIYEELKGILKIGPNEVIEDSVLLRKRSMSPNLRLFTVNLVKGVAELLGDFLLQSTPFFIVLH